MDRAASGGATAASVGVSAVAAASGVCGGSSRADQLVASVGAAAIASEQVEETATLGAGGPSLAEVVAVGRGDYAATSDELAAGADALGAGAGEAADAVAGHHRRQGLLSILPSWFVSGGLAALASDALFWPVLTRLSLACSPWPC